MTRFQVLFLAGSMFLELAFMVPPLFAQNLHSPEVHDDRRVTLRIKSSRATEVSALLGGQKIALSRNEMGIWEGTSEPLEPQIYDYRFEVDGTEVIDPSNRWVKKWLTLASLVEIPGTPPLLTEFTNVPHGSIHRVFYPSTSVGKARPVMVYTPPEYGIDPTRRFPVVVLLHGYGDDETAWTEVGRAHLIADNLIAAKRIEPVIIAMPFGHPVPISLSQRPPDYSERNNELFERDVMGDLLPFLEQRFAVQKDVAGRSIVGLSMGGGHAVDIGLRNANTFSSIGAFSAAVPELDQQTLLARYPALSGSEPTANRLKEFWIPIGEEDFLLGRNEEFHSRLKSIGIRHEFRKTSGGHEWKVWREYLPEFLERVAGNSVVK